MTEAVHVLIAHGRPCCLSRHLNGAESMPVDRCALEETSRVEEEKAEKGESRLRAVLRVAGIIVLIALGLTIIVVAICWFAGWRSASQISSGLSRAGASVILLGLLSIIGGWGNLRDSEFARSVSHQSTSAQTRQALKDSLRSFDLAVVVIAAGLLCIGVAALI